MPRASGMAKQTSAASRLCRRMRRAKPTCSRDSVRGSPSSMVSLVKIANIEASRGSAAAQLPLNLVQGPQLAGGQLNDRPTAPDVTGQTQRAEVASPREAAVGHQGAELGQVAFREVLAEVNGQVRDPAGMGLVAAQRADAQGLPHPPYDVGRARLD